MTLNKPAKSPGRSSLQGPPGRDPLPPFTSYELFYVKFLVLEGVTLDHIFRTVNGELVHLFMMNLYTVNGVLVHL